MNTREVRKRSAIRPAAPVLVATAVATVLWVSAGDLNPPPGAIMPTDRTQLNEQVITLPYTISQSGSYVLTSNLIGMSGMDGIIINAHHVTLDLNGFALTGVPGSLDGIVISGVSRNVTVRDGAVADWGGTGVDLSGGSQCRVSDLSVSGNGGHGIVLGSLSVLHDVSSTGNTMSAIKLSGDGNRLDGCHATRSDVGMDVVGANNLMVCCSAWDNGTDYVVAAGNAHGPIANVGGVGDISIVPEADHAWANFALTCNPVPELCDGQDNDCDGLVDENNPGGGAPCSTGLLGVCSQGETLCQSGALSCVQTEFPSPEICDGLDNDCDGVADEGNPGGGGACSTGLPGVCGPGRETCQFGSISCVQNEQPSPEVCDGLDNECNGSVDDGLLPPPCALQAGVCAGSTQTCWGASGWRLCSSLDYGGFYQPVESLCDGLDNDCDGQTDEGCAANGTPCATPIECSSSFCVDGFCCDWSCTTPCYQCDLWGSEGSCTAVPIGQDPHNDCPVTDFCTGLGQCCLSIGASCGTHNDCCSRRCDSWTFVCIP